MSEFAFKRELERSEPLALGYWRPLDAAGRWSATIACPQCGLVGSLVEHVIGADGNVSPSIQCPKAGCSIGRRRRTHRRRGDEAPPMPSARTSNGLIPKINPGTSRICV